MKGVRIGFAFRKYRVGMKKYNILLLMFGIIVALVLSEILLTLAGAEYRMYRLGNKKELRSHADSRILCLGDSYTFGEGAAKGYSYPEQLQALLDNNVSKKFKVFNGGVPGSNSSQLFNNLEANIKKYNPDIIIIMTGANNDSNFHQSNYFLFVDNSMKTYLYRIDSFMSNLHTYKLLKATTINIFNKLIHGMRPMRVSREINKINLSINTANKDRVKIENVPLEFREEAAHHFEMGRFYEERSKFELALEEYKKASELNPYDENYLRKIGFIYLHRMHVKNASLLAIQAFQKALEIDPLNLELREELFNTYYQEGKKELAMEELRTMLYLCPDYEIARQLLAHKLPDFQDREVAAKTLEYDLRNIIKLTASIGIKLILESYPSGHPTNRTAEKVAREHRISFIDNAAVFRKLEQSKGYRWEHYFTEDAHCNENGYKVIAENVYNTLIAQLGESELK